MAGSGTGAGDGAGAVPITLDDGLKSVVPSPLFAEMGPWNEGVNRTPDRTPPTLDEKDANGSFAVSDAKLNDNVVSVAVKQPLVPRH